MSCAPCPATVIRLALVAASVGLSSMISSPVQARGNASEPARASMHSQRPRPADTAEAASGSWLDRPASNWNTPGAAVPKPARGEYELGMDDKCKETLRTGDGPEDTQVTQAGWFLFGPRQTYTDVTLVSGTSGADGMCRPFGYHLFLFVGGRFAGTISPEPMASRMDGAAGPVSLFSDETLTAEFSRYTDDDPLCCPSSRTSVSYRIDRDGAQPVLVPADITPVSQP